MRKTKTLLLTTALLIGGFMNSFAQVEPCGWTLTNVVGQPTCYKVCNGYVSVAPTVNWPFTYVWSNGSTSNTIDNLCEDDYTVTATDDKGCSQTYTYFIVEPAQLVASCVVLTNESEPGAADGSISASAVGGTGSYNFVWQVAPPVYTSTITGLTGGLYYVLVFDDNDCSTSTSCEIITEKKECEPTGFRTQTQGGWGQCHQNGNNPGTYLFANFATAFPAGLEIGCTRKLRLTSAQAVCDFLPSGSTPSILPVGTLVNPVTYKNVLAGQLVAATINVQFDNVFPSFGSSSFSLGDMEIASGTFAGWSVNDLIAEANRKIGGCVSSYSYSTLNAALSSFNENYVDGTRNNGFLVCPSDNGRFASSPKADVLDVKVYPNPSESIAFVSVNTTKAENVEVELYNISGQKILSAFNGNVEAGQAKVVKIDASELVAGIYFVKVVTAEKVYNQKLIIKK